MNNNGLDLLPVFKLDVDMPPAIYNQVLGSHQPKLVLDVEHSGLERMGKWQVEILPFLQGDSVLQFWVECFESCPGDTVKKHPLVFAISSCFKKKNKRSLLRTSCAFNFIGRDSPLQKAITGSKWNFHYPASRGSLPVNKPFSFHVVLAVTRSSYNQFLQMQESNDPLLSLICNWQNDDIVRRMTALDQTITLVFDDYEIQMSRLLFLSQVDDENILELFQDPKQRALDLSLYSANVGKLAYSALVNRNSVQAPLEDLFQLLRLGGYLHSKPIVFAALKGIWDMATSANACRIVRDLNYIGVNEHAIKIAESLTRRFPQCFYQANVLPQENSFRDDSKPSIIKARQSKIQKFLGKLRLI
ncbi:hypothetical protein MP228_008080 [Amoeboaphelidium protococcarum]|nr:hypothetical protein MP228_008080 [Amoeboaphelidium protococcarum]